jgi:hypothetical protein
MKSDFRRGCCTTTITYRHFRKNNFIPADDCGGNFSLPTVVINDLKILLILIDSAIKAATWKIISTPGHGDNIYAMTAPAYFSLASICASA